MPQRFTVLSSFLFAELDDNACARTLTEIVSNSEPRHKTLFTTCGCAVHLVGRLLDRVRCKYTHRTAKMDHCCHTWNCFPVSFRQNIDCCKNLSSYMYFLIGISNLATRRFTPQLPIWTISIHNDRQLRLFLVHVYQSSNIISFFCRELTILLRQKQ